MMETQNLVVMMQPYFIPYVGHFSLISKSHKFVVFDLAPFRKKSWMVRNRFSDGPGKFTYVSVDTPSHTSSLTIKEINFNDAELLRRKLNGQILRKKHISPRYKIALEIVEQVFSNVENNSLLYLNTEFLRVICNYLEIDFQPIFSSSFLKGKNDFKAGDWAFNSMLELGETQYLNPESGVHLFELENWQKHGLSLYAFAYQNSFEQIGRSYMKDMSILEELIWHPRETLIQQMKKDGKVYAIDDWHVERM